MAGRGWVKYSPIFESNSAPSIRANTVQLTRADLDARAAMGPSVGWNSLLIGLFGLNCAQMTPGRAESDFGLQGWIGTSGLKQIFSLSLNLHWRNSETFFTRVSTISNKVVLLEPREKFPRFVVKSVRNNRCLCRSIAWFLPRFFCSLVIIFVPHRNSSRFTNQSKKQLDTDTSRRT